tara:strand:+ start:173 stop:1057 length:885 start_codon:yes stop_codon:yes gene_type:complete
MGRFMTKGLSELLKVLDVKQLEGDNFLAPGSRNDGAEGTYGGHLLGQAVAAANLTVAYPKRVHSLHSYFLTAGEPGESYEINVVRVRDGKSFANRRVITSQRGRVVMETSVSFCVDSKGIILSGDRPPNMKLLPEPTKIPRYPELMALQNPLPFHEDWALREHGLDIRVINAPWAPAGVSEKKGIRAWVKANGIAPDDLGLHFALAAYHSDESLADNLLVPFGLTWGSNGTFMVSLDHAMWFHKAIDFNKWHLVDQWAIGAENERGVATGRLWNQSGQLCASFTQEALIRIENY